MDTDSVVVVTVATSNVTTTAIQESTTTFNVNQSNNNIYTHANTHSGSNSLRNKTTNNIICSSNSSNISIGGSSSNSSSSSSSNSSGYGSSTTTPTNNFDLQQTTPTTTPIPTTHVPNAEHIIPVATVAAVTPFYNESITTHNLETHHAQQHQHDSQQQQQQRHMLQTNQHQYPQNLLQTNYQQQHHQYLPRQQYYSPYDYQQTAPTHNLSETSASHAVAPYNMIIPGSYEMSSSIAVPSYGTGQYKSAAGSGYERSPVLKTNVIPQTYNNHQQQQHQHQGEQEQSKAVNQQTQHFTALLTASKQRLSSLIGSPSNPNNSKPQAAATPFYANPTPFYDNFKHKMPLEYHNTYNNSSPSTTTSYHQQQKFYAAAKSQLKETSYGSPTGLNNKSLYHNTGTFFPEQPASGLNLSSGSYDKYMCSHSSATSYSAAVHLGNETPPEANNYRKPVAANTVNSTSWPWAIDYASGNSRSIPPAAGHIPTATVAPTHTTHLAQNTSVLARDSYYLAHDKYGMKYDKYTTPSYQQPYVSSHPTNRHMWPTTPLASNITPLNDRHLLATGAPALTSHGLHPGPYYPNGSTTTLNSRQSCCSQPYQPQSCYYPSSHNVPPRLPHNQTPPVAQPTVGYLTAQQTLGQSPHLNALSASCKYGGVVPDYGNGTKIKNSNDLFLSTHHYENNPAPHNFVYGSTHSSQQLYNTNAHQSVPTSLLTHDPFNANPTSYTNDLSLTTSNFDNYYPHFESHPSSQTLAGIHSPQSLPPTYGVTVAKRALLDYRKPIQPQPPPTIAEDCYASLTPREHYNQQEQLNTPETTTIFGEYDAHQSNATEAASIADRESNKNLSLRDFIANWNDDEDEYQNNEEINFDQDTVIEEVIQTSPLDQEASIASPVEDMKTVKPSLLHTKNNESLQESVTALTDSEANQYVNLPDIVIDIEKSNVNVHNSIITPTTSPTDPPLHEVSNPSLNLTNFDVEKELDELNLKKPALQELTKDLNDTTNVSTPQLSSCKNRTTQLSFEDLNLEETNKTVLNAATTCLTTSSITTTNHNLDMNEQYFKDIEGYESSCSRHSNEPAFEKEYETFINKITNESCAKKFSKITDSTDVEKEEDFEKNVRDFSKFYKRKRKLKEDEIRLVTPVTQSKKKPKTTESIKINNSNFPQVYTKKSRNKMLKTSSHRLHKCKRKPRSLYYKIIHSIRRFGLYRGRRILAYEADLKEKDLPLIKRQSIKNYSHDITESPFNAKTLKALCIFSVNTEEFRKILMSTPLAGECPASCLESEEKHICTDPTCDTCEVIKSLMEAENFETTLMEQVTENVDDNTACAPTIFCAEGDNGFIKILEGAPNSNNLNYHNDQSIMVTTEIKNNPIFPSFESKDIDNHCHNSSDVKLVAQDNIDLENWTRSLQTANLDLEANDNFEYSLQHINSQSYFSESDEYKSRSIDLAPQLEKLSKILEQPANHKNLLIDNPTISSEIMKCDEFKLNCQNNSFDDQNLNISADKKSDYSVNVDNTFLDIENDFDYSTLSETVTASPETFSVTNQNEKSEDSASNESDSESSSSDTEDSTDSQKKFNSKHESSDTDIVPVSDNDNEASNSDSHQSHCSENNKSVRDRGACYIPCSEKEPANANRTDLRLSDTEDITNGYENISNSPQRIVIRITKSSSPNDQSLRVENVFGKSFKTSPDAGNQIESETSIITQKLYLNKKDRFSKKLVEVPTGNESEDSDKTEEKSQITSAPLKLVLRRQDFTKEKVYEKSEIDNIWESESIDDIRSQKDSKVNETSPECSGKQDNKLEEKYLEVQTEKGRRGSEVLTESVMTECNQNKFSDSAVVPINFLSKAINEEVIKDQSFSKTVGTLGAVMQSEDISKQTNYEIPSVSKSSWKSEGLDDKTTLEPQKQQQFQDIISANQSKVIATPLFPEQTCFEEFEAVNKSKKLAANTEIEFEAKHDATSETLEAAFKNITANQVENQQYYENTRIKFPMHRVRQRSNECTAGTLNDINNKVENITKEIVCDDTKLSSSGDHPKEIKDSFTTEMVNSDTTSSSYTRNEEECVSKKDSFLKKSLIANIEVYNLTNTDSEDEEEEGEGQSDIEILSQHENQEMNLSGYESSCDSEYGSTYNTEALKPTKKFNISVPIVMSDEKSRNTNDFNDELTTMIECLSATSKDSLQQIQSFSDISYSNKIQEQSLDEDREYRKNDLGDTSNAINLKQVIEPKHRQEIIAIHHEAPHIEIQLHNVKELSGVLPDDKKADDIQIYDYIIHKRKIAEDAQSERQLSNSEQLSGEIVLENFKNESEDDDEISDFKSQKGENKRFLFLNECNFYKKSDDENKFDDSIPLERVNGSESMHRYTSEKKERAPENYNDTVDGISDQKREKKEEKSQQSNYLKNYETSDNDDLLALEFASSSADANRYFSEADLLNENQNSGQSVMGQSKFENDMPQKPELKIIENVDPNGKNIDEMERVTTKSIPEEKIYHSKPLLEVKEINTATEDTNKSNGMNESVEESYTLINANLKTSVENKSVADNIRKNIVAEDSCTSKSTFEHKHDIPQHLNEESISAKRHVKIITKAACKLYNSQDHFQKERLTYRGKSINSCEKSNITEEPKSFETSFHPIKMSDKAMESKEKTYTIDRQSAPTNNSNSIAEINIPQKEFVSNQDISNMLQGNISELKEAIPEIIAEERYDNLNVSPEDRDLKGIKETTNLFKSEHDISSCNCATGDCQPMSDYEIDAKNLEKAILEPITENMEDVSEIFFNDYNVSVNVNDEPSSTPNEFNKQMNKKVSEIGSETDIKRSDCMHIVCDKEIREELPNENKITAEKGSEIDLRPKSINTQTSFTDSAKEISDHYTETTAVKLQTFGQALPESVYTAEKNKKEERIKQLKEYFSEIETIDETWERVKAYDSHYSEENSKSKSTGESQSLPELEEEKKERNSATVIGTEKCVSKVLLVVIDKGDNDSLSQGEIREKMGSNALQFPKANQNYPILQKNVEKSSDGAAIVPNCQIAEGEKSKGDEDKLGIESQNIFTTESSNNLRDYRASEDSPSVNNQLQKQVEDNIMLGSSKVFKNFEKSEVVKDQQPLFKDRNCKPEHQIEFSSVSCNETSDKNVPTKDDSTLDNLSIDFCGFKNQSSFEDESEDFHGFEDLEEVTRIRQEIENLNDDSTANDGFLNNPTINRQLHKSSTASLTDSTCSEMNELEALEKELSLHQADIPIENDDRATANDLVIKPITIPSSNDIEDIKKMLESDEEQHTDGEDNIKKLAHICTNKYKQNTNDIPKDILSSVNLMIPKLSDLCRAALNSSLNSNSKLPEQQTEASSPTILLERELSVEEALAEMHRQAGVLLSDPEDGDNDMPSPGHNEAHDVLLINLQEILNSDNNDVYVLQCDMNENVLNVVQPTDGDHKGECQDIDALNMERVNTLQIILDTQNCEPQIHIISSDSEGEVIILSDEESEFNYTPISTPRVTIPFISDNDNNDSDSLFDISTIHHEEIVPDNLQKFLQEEFYKYIREKYVQRNISKYYHANRVLKKYKKRFIRSMMQ